MNKHFSTTLLEEHINQIDKLCHNIQNKKQKVRPFSPYAWIQDKANKGNVNPQAIIDTLKAVNQYWDHIKQPWAYASNVFKTLNQNYYEKKGEVKKVKELDKLLDDIKIYINTYKMRN